MVNDEDFWVVLGMWGLVALVGLALLIGLLRPSRSERQQPRPERLP